MVKVSVIGAGSWGLALALVLNKNGNDVTMWSALPNEIDTIKAERENKRCLPGVIIPNEIHLTNDMNEALENKDVIVLAVASPYVRSTISKFKGIIKPGQLIVNVAKGVEESTLFTLTQVVEDELPGTEVAVLSGPSHAEEVSRFIPTTCVIGARNEETATYLQNIFMNDDFRIYTSTDVIGMELGGSLKNVIALAAGMADGLGYGDNTKAALITRGIHEIARLGVAMGGNINSFYGLTGIGDLIVTCASMHSRNRRAGILIGQGKSMEEAMEEVQMVVEGVYSAKAALLLSKKYGISMPITEKINEVLFEGKNPREAVSELMKRNRKGEYE